MEACIHNLSCDTHQPCQVVSAPCCTADSPLVPSLLANAGTLSGRSSDDNPSRGQQLSFGQPGITLVFNMPIRLSLALGLLALLRLNSSAVIVGSDDFNYANGPINNQSGGNGWNRAGGISLWSGGSSFPLVSAQVLYTGTNFGASRAYGADETNSAFYGSGMLFFRVTMLLGATVPSVAGMSSFDFGTEKVFFGRVTNTTFGISEPGFGTRALTSGRPRRTDLYTGRRAGFRSPPALAFCEPDGAPISTTPATGRAARP